MHSDESPLRRTTPMTQARWRVRLHPDPLSIYLWHLVSGLSMLSRQGEIDFEVGPVGSHVPWEPQAALLEVEDRVTQTSRTVVIDLRDGHTLGAPQRRHNADVIFKRSYAPGEPDYEHPDVRPYGLVFLARAGKPNDALRMALSSVRGRYGGDLRRRLRLHAAAMRPAVDLVAERLPRIPASLPRPLAAFEASPEDPADNTVLFQTKAWEPARGIDPEDRRLVNDERAATIRLLRKELGPRFVGGFVPSPFAAAHYSDCITDQPTDQMSFLRLVQSSAVVVATKGLHLSTPFKVAEYLAASRAIVSDPITTCLPASLDHDRHFLSFASPEQCVERCVRLINDDDIRHRLREGAGDYYRNEVQPDVLIRNRLLDLSGAN